MNKKLPTYELFLEDNENIALALVENPAIETDFIYFNNEVVKMEFNEEQMIVKGPALIPNKKIYRNDNIGERNVFMSEKTVINFAEYLINKQGAKFNLGHTDNIIEANLVESYFAIEPNEFNVPKGSWIIALKLKSIDAWNQVKNGEFKGFSVEGLFSNEFSNFNNNNNNKEQMNLKEKLSAAINAVLFGETTPEVIVPEVTPEISTEEFAAGDPIVPEVAPELEVEVEQPEPLTEEKVQEMINEAVMSATEQIMVAVKELMTQSTETATAMSAMSAKLEEFSKQPLSQPITETVTNTQTDSSYNYLKGVSLK